MPPGLWSLYESMLRRRLFEEAVAQLWRDGLISGEMHRGRNWGCLRPGRLAAPLRHLSYLKLIVSCQA